MWRYRGQSKESCVQNEQKPCRELPLLLDIQCRKDLHWIVCRANWCAPSRYETGLQPVCAPKRIRWSTAQRTAKEKPETFEGPTLGW